jgi:hypothetical protein
VSFVRFWVDVNLLFEAHRRARGPHRADKGRCGDCPPVPNRNGARCHSCTVWRRRPSRMSDRSTIQAGGNSALALPGHLARIVVRKL